MSLAADLIKNFNELPDDKKKEVIDFVEFLKVRSQKNLEKAMDELIEDNKLVEVLG